MRYVMRILIAPDKFKDSLGAADVAGQIAAGLGEILPTAEIVQLPVADGGEGTAEIICQAVGGDWYECEIRDPLGRVVRAKYCTIEHGATAVMEMSQASGLWRVTEAERDPMRGNTFGTSELLLEAARLGVDEILIGLGGSATNDGGFGMARALGYKFLDQAGANLSGPISELLHLARIEKPDVLKSPRITAAVDVRNHLLGKHGATHTFGVQKGATPQQIETLERSLKQLADIAQRDLGCDFRDQPGAGAAGGLGYGLMTFCGAKVRSGFEVVAGAIGLEAAVAAADVVITGEGRLDEQTAEGKSPAGVARLAKAHGKPVFAIVGSSTVSGRELFDAIFVLSDSPQGKAAAMADAGNLLKAKARELAQLLQKRG